MLPGEKTDAAIYYRQIFETRGPLAPPSSHRPNDLQDAYDIQRAWVASFEDGSRGPVVGYKIALTTPVMQKFLGFDQPCIGPVFENNIYKSPAELKFNEFGHPGIECEIAVKLGDDLDGGPYDRIAVAEAVDVCMAAIEVIDDQNADYELIDAYTLIASGAWNGGCILSSPASNWRDMDLRDLAGTLMINEVELETGRGGEVMGHPFEALAFVANTLASQGRPLRSGMIVMTGSVVETKWAKQGDNVTVRMTDLGEAHASFR